MPQALEPLQTSLTLTDGLVRVLDAVVLAPAAEMGDGRQDDDHKPNLSLAGLAIHLPAEGSEFRQVLGVLDFGGSCVAV